MLLRGIRAGSLGEDCGDVVLEFSGRDADGGDVGECFGELFPEVPAGAAFLLQGGEDVGTVVRFAGLDKFRDRGEQCRVHGSVEVCAGQGLDCTLRACARRPEKRAQELILDLDFDDGAVFVDLTVVVGEVVEVGGDGGQ